MREKVIAETGIRETEREKETSYSTAERNKEMNEDGKRTRD